MLYARNHQTTSTERPLPTPTTIKNNIIAVWATMVTLYIGYSSVVGHISALLLINVGDNHTMNNWIDKSILRTAANNN